MIDLKLDIGGLEDLAKAIQAAPNLIEATLPQLAMQAGQDVVNNAQMMFRWPKSGQERVSRDGSGRIMIGSAPGEAPAIDTGELDRSFTSVLQAFTVTVQPNTPYAAELEGTRPYMKPSFDKASATYYLSVMSLLSKVL